MTSLREETIMFLGDICRQCDKYASDMITLDKAHGSEEETIDRIVLSSLIMSVGMQAVLIMKKLDKQAIEKGGGRA